MISIAFTAVVQPSRILRGLTRLFCLAVLGVSAWLIWRGQVVPALIGVLASAAAVLHWRARQEAQQIAISGLGHMRLTVYKYLGKVNMPNQLLPKARSPTVFDAIVMQDHVVYLRAGSTIWPILLLLCLETEYGHRITLIIMRDSVGDAVFRALTVAIKAISTREQADKKNTPKRDKK